MSPESKRMKPLVKTTSGEKFPGSSHGPEVLPGIFLPATFFFQNYSSGKVRIKVSAHGCII